MLVTSKGSLYPVGVAITQWKIDGSPRMFVLYPLRQADSQYAEVECITHADESLKVVEPQTADWQKLDNGFGDDSYGYPMDEHVREMIYAVWDDGAKKQMGSAERLYQAYEALIKRYIPDALKYLERIRDDTFQKEIAEAKKNGWDASIIKKRQLEFPYVNLATS